MKTPINSLIPAIGRLFEDSHEIAHHSYTHHSPLNLYSKRTLDGQEKVLRIAAPT